MKDIKIKIIQLIIISLVIIGIFYLLTNDILINKIARHTGINQEECDGEAVTYTFKSDKKFVIYEQGISIPVFYSLNISKNPKSFSLQECKEFKVYCINQTEFEIINKYDGTINQEIKPNTIFIANSSNSEIVDCFNDACLYRKINSLEVC